MKPLPLAARAGEIAPFRVMEILARAKALEAAGRDVIHLEIGEPDFATPAPIVEAGVRALRDGHTHYTGALGLIELREAIAAFHATRWNAPVDAARVIVTPGASGALLLALGLLAGPDDEVLMADPGYPCNRHFARFCEARTVSVPVDAATGFQLTRDLVAAYATPATRAVLVALALLLPAQALFTYAPFMNTIFDTRPLGFTDLVLLIAIGIFLMLLLEVEKLLMRRLGWFKELNA